MIAKMKAKNILMRERDFNDNKFVFLLRFFCFFGFLMKMDDDV